MNKTLASLTAASALLAVAAGAFAQKDGGMTASPLSGTDRQFLTQCAQGSISDYANGAAGVQSGSQAVRQYGIRVMEDHDRLNIEIMQLAGRRGLQLPLTMAEADTTKLNALTERKGMDFDREFLRGEVQTNAQDVADAQKELAATTDPEVRIVVTDYLNTEQAHLAEARRIQAGMGAMSGRR